MQPSVRALATLSLLVLLAAFPATAGAREASGGPAGAWFTEQYRRLGIELTATDLDRLTGAWAPAAARREALSELLAAMIEIQDAGESYPQGPPSAWLARVDELQGLETPPDPLPGPTSPTSVEPLGRVVETGEGPLPVVLLAGEIPADAAFGELLALHGDRFRALSVDLPGIGGTPPPLPEVRDYEARPWLRAVADGVVQEVRNRGLDRPVLVGHGLGSLVAVELAREHPEAFRGAVLVSPVRPVVLEAILHGNYAIFTAPDATRRAIVQDALPPVLPAGPPEDRLARTGLAPAVPFLAQDADEASRLGAALGEVHPTVLERYLREALTIDRRAALDGLEVPTLFVFPFHDPSSSFWNLSVVGAGFWKQALLDHPEAPVRAVTFEDVRDPFSDRPLELGRAIADFAAGRPAGDVPGDAAFLSNQTSTARSVSAAVGATELRVEYWSPRARGRELWGGLVPWDRVWRAGANEGTRLSVSRPVEIGGEPLEAGEYGVMVHPREDGPWTLILNRVPWLWSTLGYDAAYDALTLDVEPERGRPWTEALTYQVAETSAGRGELSLAWGDLRLGADVLALGGGLEIVHPVEPARLEALGGWTELATDPEGDAANQPVLHDGTALAAAYECATDRVWFRFDLAAEPHESNIGLNVAVDTDRDLSTGTPWWASNRAATFDRLVTLWAEGSDEGGYVGTIGIADASHVATREFSGLQAGGLDLGIDRRGHRLDLGVPAGRLDDDGELALVATVGTNLFWNDDLIDEGQRELSLPELRRRGCGG